MESAVIDRFEGKLAVVVVGASEAERELIVPRKQLPPRSRAGHWLKVEVANDQLISAEYDRIATRAVRRRIAKQLERLRRGDHLTDSAETV